MQQHRTFQKTGLQQPLATQGGWKAIEALQAWDIGIQSAAAGWASSPHDQARLMVMIAAPIHVIPL